MCTSRSGTELRYNSVRRSAPSLFCPQSFLSADFADDRRSNTNEFRSKLAACRLHLRKSACICGWLLPPRCSLWRNFVIRNSSFAIPCPSPRRIFDPHPASRPLFFPRHHPNYKDLRRRFVSSWEIQGLFSSCPGSSSRKQGQFVQATPAPGRPRPLPRTASGGTLHRPAKFAWIPQFRWLC